MLIQFLPHRQDTSFTLPRLSVSYFTKTISMYSETHECRVSQYVSQVVYISTTWLHTIKAQLKLKVRAFTNNISSEIRK
jgi:hypothetical protein